MARLTSTIFVSQMIRRVNGAGGFAAVLRKGADEAGAIHVLMRQGKNGLAFYRPAMQLSYDAQTTGGRLFQLDRSVTDDQSVTNFIDKESRFDPDFWVVELDGFPPDQEAPFDVMKP